MICYEKIAKPYLDAVLRSLDAIDEYRPETFEQLRDDPMRADAILMRLIEIGEMVRTIRDDFPEEFETHHHPDWYRVIGLRHIIAHEYGKVTSQ